MLAQRVGRYGSPLVMITGGAESPVCVTVTAGPPRALRKTSSEFDPFCVAVKLKQWYL